MTTLKETAGFLSETITSRASQVAARPSALKVILNLILDFYTDLALAHSSEMTFAPRAGLSRC